MEPSFWTPPAARSSRCYTLWDRTFRLLAYTGEGTSMYLTGYDQTHVRVYHPESGATEVLSMETANQMLGAAGYDFICCVPTL